MGVACSVMKLQGVHFLAMHVHANSLLTSTVIRARWAGRVKTQQVAPLTHTPRAMHVMLRYFFFKID